ncbi:MAG: TcpQ domain-containing protein [Alphaproteobacteria bacterium]|nr:TcpQ domain-containing protein [Alphaproteobacteria bacterium]
MAAIAMVALTAIVSAAAPAEAGFRYVPAAGAGEAGAQADAGARTERVGAGHADPAPGSGPAVSGRSVSGTSISGARVSGTRVWRIHAGETLRAALSRWAARAGADVTFLTDRRYRLDGAAAFEGAFPDAVEALFRGLAHLPHPPAGAVSTDGRSLAVTHRMRRTAERGDGQ